MNCHAAISSELWTVVERKLEVASKSVTSLTFAEWKQCLFSAQEVLDLRSLNKEGRKKAESKFAEATPDKGKESSKEETASEGTKKTRRGKKRSAAETTAAWEDKDKDQDTPSPAPTKNTVRFEEAAPDGKEVWSREKLLEIRAGLPCRDAMGSGCSRGDACQYSHDGDLIAAAKVKKVNAVATETDDTSKSPDSEESDKVKSVKVSVKGIPAHRNDYDHLDVDDDDSLSGSDSDTPDGEAVDEEFSLERPSSRVTWDTRQNPSAAMIITSPCGNVTEGSPTVPTPPTPLGPHGTVLNSENSPDEIVDEDLEAFCAVFGSPMNDLGHPMRLSVEEQSPPEQSTADDEKPEGAADRVESAPCVSTVLEEEAADPVHPLGCARDPAALNQCTCVADISFDNMCTRCFKCPACCMCKQEHEKRVKEREETIRRAASSNMTAGAPPGSALASLCFCAHGSFEGMCGYCEQCSACCECPWRMGPHLPGKEKGFRCARRR